MSGETFPFRPGVLRQMMRFEAVEGPRTGEMIEVALPEPGEPPVLIGRSRDCAIWIDAQNIGRRNTELLSGPDRQPMVRDMGSVNGTLLNGQPVSQTQPLPLRLGDRLRVGLSELIFRGLTVPQVTPGPSAGPPISNPLPGAPTIGVGTPLIAAVPTPPAVSTNLNAFRPATLPGTYFIYLMMRDGQRYQLDGEEITVGRGQANDIVIDNNSISRQHARLQKTPNGVYVQDLGSTNKTFVNGIQADAPVLLRDGDLVRFGEVEADYKLESQRVTQSFKTLSRSDLLPDPAAEITQPDAANEATFVGDQTFVGIDVEQTFVGDRQPNAARPTRREIEQSETALDLDIRKVGRVLRQASSATDDRAGEVVRLEGVLLTEGQGRSLDTLLDSVNLNLKKGELVVVVGPSGSGKTELLQVMAGLRAADRGRVAVLGRQLPTQESTSGRRPDLENDRELIRWRQMQIGYLPSQADLDPRLSALEHITAVLEQAGFGHDPRERQERALERLAFVGLTDPEVVRLRPPDLNRAERKQVALARALTLDPLLLLADEPVGNLHSAAADNIFKVLRKLVEKGRTVLMVTSDQLWARNADRQIEILDGSIVGSLS